MKPIELIKSKTQSSSLITQLWFERAQKVMNSIEHVSKLLEFISYSGMISHRFNNEYIP